MNDEPLNPTPERRLMQAEARIAKLKAALTSLRLTARVLLQNAEGCAVNHYGEDFQLHGEPGWLADSRKTIEAAEAVLGIGKPTA